MKKLAIFLAVLIVLGLAFWGGYTLFFNEKPANVTIEIEVPREVSSGKPFELKVIPANNSEYSIENSKLSLVLPEGVSASGDKENLRVLEENIGDIAPSSINPASIFKLIVSGGADSVKKVRVVFRYKIPGSTTDFEMRKEAEIIVGRSSADIEIISPERVFSGEDFEIKFVLKNQTEEDLKNVEFKASFPPSFRMESSEPKADEGESLWEIASLRKGSSEEVVIKGVLLGSEGASASFSGMLSADFSGKRYEVASQSRGLGISVSPLSLEIKTQNVADPKIFERGDKVNYILTIKNNSPITLNSIKISAALSGEMFSYSTVRSDGFLNSQNNTLNWTSATSPTLASLTPGQEASVSFSIDLKEDFGIRRIADKNYSVRVKAQAESNTVPPGTSAQKTIAVSELESRLAGYMEATSFIRFKDATTGILNTGPFLPRVNRATQYTIHWQIKNYSTDMKDVRFSAELKNGARFTGKVKSTVSAVPEYNADKSEVYWNIGDLAATKGLIGGVVEGIFQIEHTPGINMADKDVEFISSAGVIARDAFTGGDFATEAKGLSLKDVEDSIGSNTRKTVLP